MNDRARNRYDRAARIKTFGEQVGPDFAPGSIATNLFAENSQLVSDVDEAKADQLRSRDTGKEILLDAIRLDLIAISRTARIIGRAEPGFADAYHLPESPGEGALCTAGDAILAKLKKPGAAPKFIAHEMDPDFVTHLETDLAAIRNYKDSAESGREDSVEATAAIARLVKRSGEIKEALDAIMHNKYERTDPDKLRRWMTASHLERQPRKSPPPPATNDDPQNPAPPKSDNNTPPPPPEP